jgi:hypothetical protein
MSPTPEERGDATSPTGDDISCVGDDEWLLRRFPNEPDQYDRDKAFPRLNIFLPLEGDVDGLSLYREGPPFLAAEEVRERARSERVRRHGGVAAVLTAKVRHDLRLTVTPSHDDTPGHVIIPELNRIDYDRKEADGSRKGKQKIKALADLLLRIAEMRIHPTAKPK